MQNHWRSLLFVPADNPSRQQKAVTVGADAVILDLEDGVAADAKASAREGIAAAATQLHDAGVTVTVRINTGWLAVMADLNAAVCPAVSAIMLPKVESAAHAEVIGEMLGEFEVERGLPLGSIGLIALIESPAGLTALDDIAKVERVIGLALGPEPGASARTVVDLSADQRRPATEARAQKITRRSRRWNTQSTKQAECPHHIVIDRCLVFGDPGGGTRVGVALNGRALAVLNSWLRDFKEAGKESQATFIF